MAEPVKIPTLLKRGGTYSFRRVVPVRLRPLLNGKREWVMALKTKDKAEAAVLAMEMVAKTDKIIEGLWARLKRVSREPLTPAQVAQIHAQNLIEGATDWNLDQWDEERGELVTDVDVERDRIREGLENGTISEVIKKELDAVLSAHQMHLTAAARKAYEGALAQAHLRALTVIERRASGENVVSLDGLLKAYLVDRKHTSERTQVELRAIWERFVLAMAGKAAAEVTRADVRAYKAALSEGRAPATVTKIMTILSSVFRFGVLNELVPANPCDGLSRSTGQRGRTVEDAGRQPYSGADLEKLFGAEWRALPMGPRKLIPLVCLFTGARLAEVSGLEKADVVTEGGITYLHIRPNTTRAVKTSSSVRKVPIHAALVRAGFLDFVAQAAGPAVFSLTQWQHGRTGYAVGKFWHKWQRARGIADKTKVFHSLRGTFLDALREAGVDPEAREQLLGHAPASVHRKYGSRFSLAALNGFVQAVKYPTVEL